MNTKNNVEDLYPLSPMQQGMLFHSVYEPGSGVYVEQMTCELLGSLDRDAFEQAWIEMLRRHTILRTAYLWENLEEPLQLVFKRVSLPVDVLDWRAESPELQEAHLEAYLHDDCQKGFNLTRPPLMRLALIQVSEERTILVWSHHHLLLDGWSIPLLLQEVFACYQAFSSGHDIRMEEPRPFRDYIAWLKQQDQSAAEKYWREQLKGFEAPIHLKTEHPGWDTGEEQAVEIEHLLDEKTTGRLVQLAHQARITLSTLVQAAWAVLLSRYSGEEDIVFGATVSGRPADLPGADQMVGLFINTLPMRARVDENAQVQAWLEQFQQQQAELHQYEYSPLVQVQSWSEVPHNQPLFDTLLVYENYPSRDLSEGGGSLRMGRVHSFSKTNYPLMLVSGTQPNLMLKIGFDARRFDRGYVGRMLAHLQTLLEGMASHPQAQIRDLPMLTSSELEQSLQGWNQTAAPFTSDRCVHQLIEDWVRRTPDALAVSYLDDEITYSELNRRANRLARHLQAMGIGPEKIVGIHTHSSIETIVGILAVLKAGGAYLPLDPTYPSDRLKFMVTDSGCALILTQAKLAGHPLEGDLPVILLDVLDETIQSQDSSDLLCSASPENLAYVIYTSGTTGAPKGALLEHRGLCNQVEAYVKGFGLGPHTRELQFAALGFDASVCEIFTALCSGGSIHTAPRELFLSIPEFVRFLNRRQINFIQAPPSMWKELPVDELPYLTTCLTAGEACTPEVMRRWVQGHTFINAYGPTETTIGPSYHICSEEDLAYEIVSIGKPIQNVQFYVLDREKRPAPVEVNGELYIGGVGVGRGYLNRPDLSAHKFLANPFGTGRVYRTGDLVRRRPNGEVEFIGRVDHQIKLRGFRIELGEIEACLTGLEGIKQAACMVVETPTKAQQLAAYIVEEDGDNWQPAGLRQELKKHLPDYMIPAAFVKMDALPRTPAGKVDRKALPPAFTEGEDFSGESHPLSDEELALATIWKEVLGQPALNLEDNFFDLGGHSLLAMQLVSRVREVFGVEVSVKNLFENGTISAMLAEIREARQKAELGEIAPEPEIVREQGQAQREVSYAQQRLWFIDQLEPGSAFYNVPSAIRVRGMLDSAALQRSLDAVAARHEVLRTRVVSLEGKPVQEILSEVKIPLVEKDVSHLEDAEKERAWQLLARTEAQAPFNLAEPPLLRILLVHLGPNDAVLLLTMHHIITDGWSMTVLVQEISEFYRAFAGGETPQIEDLPVQYADYAAWQRKWLSGEVLEKQLSYWRETLKGAPPLLELPTDRPRPPIKTSHGGVVRFSIDRETVLGLRKIMRAEGVTLYMLLLAAYQTLLYRYSRQEDVSVGSVIANRRRKELESLIGYFVNTLVMRTDLGGDPTFRDALKRVRGTALGAYSHQDVPFEMVVEAVQPRRNLSYTPLFQVGFDLQSATRQVKEIGGLTFEGIEFDSGLAMYDLLLSLKEQPDELDGTLEYNSDLFNHSRIERMVAHYQQILRSIVKNPSETVNRLELLTPEEKRLLVQEWSFGEVIPLEEETIQERFEKRVAETPGQPAIEFEGRALTYAELNQKANQLGRRLRKMGVAPDQIVGILAERSLEMVIGILGVMKAGAAYLPLDPRYPPDRLQFMIEDSETRLILTQEQVKEEMTWLQTDTFCLDRDWPQLETEAGDNLDPVNSRANLAYVIYTSGSTGRPKGALLPHGGLINLSETQRRAFEITRQSRVLQFSALSFDASVWETFMALGNGGTLVLARQEVLANAPELAALLKDKHITTVTLPPTVLSILPEAELPELNTVIAAGEACSSEIAARWAPGRKFFNAYGPTETTVCASMQLISADRTDHPGIGRPVANSRLYVMEPGGSPAPIGVPGELYIGGRCVGRGYHKREDLSREKFIPDPYDGTSAGRLYRSGDLVRYREDGNVEFLGRIDQQVKVRGFRIELGEIEEALKACPGVKDAAVMAREDVAAGGKRLVAYVVGSADDPAVSSSELRRQLRERLPEYMVPGYFVLLESLPLSPSGKVNRKALPEPDGMRPDIETEYVAPHTALEQSLANICQELLSIERVGMDDNFFELGGHSLLATQYISRIRDEFNVELPLRSLFETPTVAGLAVAIENARVVTTVQPQAPAITAVSREGRRVRVAVPVEPKQAPEEEKEKVLP